MSLQEVYPKIRPAIFALVPKYTHPSHKGGLPPVLGTVFFVREDGLAMTNAHVIEAFREVFRPEDAPEKDWPVQGLFFVRKDEEILAMRVDVLAVIGLGSFLMNFPGRSSAPDVGLVQMDVSSVPFLSLNPQTELQEGMEVATAGFPSGRRALESPGGLQLGPTLQRGIVSALLPFPGPRPQAFSVNIMTHGGASGSPVFDPRNGSLLGILFSSLQDVGSLDQGRDTYAMPTTITYALPSSYLLRVMEMAPSVLRSTPSFDQRITGIKT
jgi:S1-C subfamily serine protease